MRDREREELYTGYEQHPDGRWFAMYCNVTKDQTERSAEGILWVRNEQAALTAPEAPAATTCDCGKTPEACAATEDCSGQSMPAAAHERERAAVEFAANYRIWQNELSRTPSDETLRTAATYNKTLAFNKFIAADNAYLAASGRGKS